MVRPFRLRGPGWRGAGSRVAGVRDGGRFEEVEKLVGDQEYVKARERVVEIRRAARAAGRDGDVARALVREAQILTGQGQFETAADLLQAEALPKDRVAAAAVELERASVVSNYLTSYSYEIRKRERVTEEAQSVRRSPPISCRKG